MLPKPQRLNLKKDFKWVASGKKIESKFLKLFLRVGDTSASSGPRIGIALSSKNFKNAVDRNKARRLTSKAFEVLYENLPKSINIVALPKAGVVSVKSGDIVLDLEALLKNEKIID